MNNVSPEQVPAPTLEDVAQRAGVSTATVSRCLNKPGVVRPKTRERIEQAIAELGYTPHQAARALASNRTGTIGVVIPTMENAIFARGLQAMEEVLAEHGVTLLVATSNYEPHRELEKIKTLVARGVDGLALIGFERLPQAHQFLAARGRPFVLLWNYNQSSPYPCIGFDNHSAAKAMAERVIALGHLRIAMIAGQTNGNDRAAARVAGVREALAGHGMDLDADSLIECHYSIAQGEAAAQRLLAGPQKPTALICGNDVLAAGALHYARKSGHRVPEECSIVGFDDIDLASIVDPELTTVRVPHRQMGQAAAEMLLALTNQAIVETRICFKTEIIERGSLGPVAISNAS